LEVQIKPTAKKSDYTRIKEQKSAEEKVEEGFTDRMFRRGIVTPEKGEEALKKMAQSF
jgi:hypothetical protein